MNLGLPYPVGLLQRGGENWHYIIRFNGYVEAYLVMVQFTPKPIVEVK